MKKYQIIMNNVDKVSNYVDKWLDVRTVYMNSIFAGKELRKLAKLVPRNFDVESIKKFEKETGLILKYYVFENKYDFFEYTSLGVWPDNDKYYDKEKEVHRFTGEGFMDNYLEHFDIIVVDRVSNIKKGNK